MNLKNVLVMLFIVAISLVGLLTWVTQMNNDYGMTVGTTFNSTLNSVNLVNNLTNISKDLADSASEESGANTGGGITALVSKSLTAITILPELLGLVPSIMNDFMGVLKIPETIQQIVRILFISVFALTIAYLLILGVQKFTS